ncbi:accessory Sec system S-layer assembly protein [Brevibacillus massiliensis]|uniref:accessory Sec system S-layer assembly protein n=1 Tax=Brevibacillus massiliensis TaxID=1118054 RepID=UPI00031400E7|nr:accessory Sec system S-layer assembly protein [Brevibacillus massiliensis]
MLSFVKNWLNKDSAAKEENTQTREESVLPAAEAPIASEQQQPSEADSKKTAATALSLHESWQTALDDKQRYALSFMANELPPIEVGHVGLAGIHMAPHDDGAEVTAFIRNGLPQPIQLGKMNLVVLFGENELFTRQEFDLSELGEIPAFHARPWSFVFHRDHFLQKGVLLTNWKVAFELAEKKMVLPQKLELEESWIKALSDDQKNSLIQLAKRLPPLKPGEVNIQSVQLSKSQDGSLRAMLLIRNGSRQSLSFEKLPLRLHDATDEVVAEGLFELAGLTVHSETSKPWMFIFPPESVVKEDADLSRWKVTAPQRAGA